MFWFASSFSIVFCLCSFESMALKFSRPSVYVVTPASNPQIDEKRSAPFYYHNWMRRMDLPFNTTKTTTTTTPKPETPDLIFAEFESDGGDSMKKSIRKLLEKEKIESKPTTTTKYIKEDEPIFHSQMVNYGLPESKLQLNQVEKGEQSTSDMSDYKTMYHQMHNEDPEPAPAPVYLPLTTPSTTTSTTTTTTSPVNLESVWHIIDSEKHNEYSGNWDEVPLDAENSPDTYENIAHGKQSQTQQIGNDDDQVKINFAVPGFGTNPGNGAENESRAIRVEPNIRFPYINLKQFEMKNMKPLTMSNKKANSNLYTNLDNFQEVKNPVRGEAQDIVPMRQPIIERYNPAQPYLPQTNYGHKKQARPSAAPAKAVANLVPPPPPPPPRITDDDFPSPTSYESFPPYAPSGPAPASPPSSNAAPSPPVVMYQPPVDNSADLDIDDGSMAGPPMDMGYQYNPPEPSAPTFLPTIPPMDKPHDVYSYDKPTITFDSPPTIDKPVFHGYHYKKPEIVAPPDGHPSPSYDHHGPPSHHHDSDYPELIYSKPHGNTDDSKGSSGMKGGDMVGMVPPPPPHGMPDMQAPEPPTDDQGFPHDFPGDFKYHHDFDDHEFYHHHHHHPTTTTTTTTEMPRVNRYSYYYLGKKLYYLPLYFSVYFIIYVGALIIKAVLRHKITYPNSWRPNDQTASYFSKRSIDSWDLSHENLHEVTSRVTRAIGSAAEKYLSKKARNE